MVRLKHYAPIAAGLGLILVAAFPFTSLTGHAHWEKIRWVPFVSPPIKAIDIAGNIMLGMPAGIAMASRTLAGPAAIALTVGTVSFVCEFAQVFSHHRFPSVSDWLYNVGGALAVATWMARRRRTNTLARGRGHWHRVR